jgi:type III pantothenate kinase
LNLCIDIGNTNAKAGFFEKDTLLEVKSNLSDRSILKLLKGEDKPDHVLISSVRKGTGRIIQHSNKITDTLVLSHKTPLPFKSLYHTPETLGLDRMAAVAGSNILHPKQNCLVVDIGTCITYDLIDESGTYHGGGISPGIEMRLKAMHKFTSKLPIITFNGSTELIGKTTKQCMLSGVANGTIAEIEGILYRYKQFFEDLTIIFCGGGSKFFETKIKEHIFAVPNLVLIGLNRILRYNLND